MNFKPKNPNILRPITVIFTLNSLFLGSITQSFGAIEEGLSVASERVIEQQNNEKTRPLAAKQLQNSQPRHGTADACLPEENR